MWGLNDSPLLEYAYTVDYAYTLQGLYDYCGDKVIVQTADQAQLVLYIYTYINSVGTEVMDHSPR